MVKIVHCSNECCDGRDDHANGYHRCRMCFSFGDRVAVVGFERESPNEDAC